MRSGTELRAHDRRVPFSYFPTAPTVPRPKVQSLLFAVDPWLIMKRAIDERCTVPAVNREAKSYLTQAEDFFRSAQNSDIGAAKPVQLYYSYLNLAKALVLCKGQQNTLPNVQHGISETLPTGGAEFADAELVSFHSPNARSQSQAFDELIQSLGSNRLPNTHRMPLKALLPQILPGHRLWATAAEKPERFIALSRIGFFQNASSKKAWLRLYLFSDDVRRLGLSQEDALERSGLKTDFRKVKCDEVLDGRKQICFEQTTPLSFARHGVDLAADLANAVRDRLWVTVASTPPYRRYYLYMCPASERQHLVQQLGSIYMLTYYLGSITRYRPTVYSDILEGEYGARIAEFVSGQAAQFVYLMASEFVNRDVTKPSIV